MILSHQTACSGQCAHDRAVELSSPRNLCVPSVSALDSSFFEASRIAKSNLLIFFRTLLHSSKSQLLSFQANPNSFPKTPGGGYTRFLFLPSCLVCSVVSVVKSSSVPFRLPRHSFAPSVFSEGSLACSERSQGATSLRRRPVGAPLECRCFTTENAPYPFSLHIVAGLFLQNEGGYVHPHPSHSPRGSRMNQTRTRPRFASQPRFSLVNLASPTNRKSTLLYADPLFCADQGASHE